MTDEKVVEGGAVVPASMARDAKQFGFSPGRFAGDALMVSGQVGFDDHGSVPDGAADQIVLAFNSLSKVLADAGMTLDDVASITSYHVGKVSDQFETFVSLKSRFFRDPYPAWTSVGVSSLADPRFLVEISAVAHKASRNR